MRRFFVVAVLAVVGVMACGSGSTTSSSGSPTPTPGGDCTTQECFADVQCRKGDCSGPLTSAGCCACAAGYVDNTTCRADAGDAAAQKAECAPPCATSEICVRPGACSFDAHCVARAQVTCPDSGLCTTTGCAGELRGDALDCVCR